MLARDSVVEFDAEGNLVREHETPQTIRHLGATSTGEVYAITDDVDSNYFVRMNDEDDADYVEVAVDGGDWFDAFAVTDEAILIVGHSGVGPVLYTIDLDGVVLSREVLEDVRDTAYSLFTGVGQGADGTVFVAGGDGYIFVDTWP
jgi:hypothetical protein